MLVFYLDGSTGCDEISMILFESLLLFIFCCFFASKLYTKKCNYWCYGEQTCRCHGIPLDDAFGQQIKRCCPVTGNDLETSDLDKNSVKVGEHTVLFLPSFQCCEKLQRVAQPVDLIVIERTNLGSLSEGKC